MRVLVVGAGASIEEAIRCGAPDQFYPPTMENFAERMWVDESGLCGFYNYWIEDYLVENGFTPTNDPTKAFIDLSKQFPTHINIERLFEYCWLNKGRKFADDWDNLIWHGILNPLNFLIVMGFHENGVGLKKLKAGQLVSSHLTSGDLVLNLNYDTLFELAAEQAGVTVTYVPYPFKGNGLLIAKPHGSMNLRANKTSFRFDSPNAFSSSGSSGDDLRNYTAIIPPRYNKRYDSHPIAAKIISSISSFQPSIITFWGVSLTDSDADLCELYMGWKKTLNRVEIINPDKKVCSKVEGILNIKSDYFPTLDNWINNKN